MTIFVNYSILRGGGGSNWRDDHDARGETVATDFLPYFLIAEFRFSGLRVFFCFLPAQCRVALRAMAGEKKKGEKKATAFKPPRRTKERQTRQMIFFGVVANRETLKFFGKCEKREPRPRFFIKKIFARVATKIAWFFI